MRINGLGNDIFQNPSKDFMKEKAKIRTFKTNIVIMWALALNLLTFNTWYPQKGHKYLNKPPVLR